MITVNGAAFSACATRARQPQGRTARSTILTTSYGNGVSRNGAFIVPGKVIQQLSQLSFALAVFLSEIGSKELIQ